MIYLLRQHRVSGLKKMLLAAMLLQCQSGMPLSAAVSDDQFKSVKHLAVAGCVVGGVGIIAALTAHYRHHLVEKKIAAFSGRLHSLRVAFDSMPFNDFREQADNKIAEVRELLERDYEHHREHVLKDVEKIAVEISHLRHERDVMIAELNKQRSFLGEVQAFLETVRDQQGSAFLQNVVAAKQEIAALITQLDEQRLFLTAKLNEIVLAVDQQNAVLASQESEMSTVKSAITSLDSLVQQRRTQLDQATRVTQQLSQESEKAQQVLENTRRSYQLTKTTVDSAVEQLSSYVKSIKSQQRILDEQVRNTQRGLNEVDSYVHQLQDDVKRSSGTFSEIKAMAPSMVYNQAPVAAYEAPKENKQRAAAPLANNNTTVTREAVALMAKVFALFGPAPTETETFRKAYIAFCKKNHPDHGGSKPTFQAIAGLYKVLLAHGLFEDATARVANAVITEIQRKMNDTQAEMNNVRW